MGAMTKMVIRMLKCMSTCEVTVNVKVRPALMGREGVSVLPSYNIYLSGWHVWSRVLTGISKTGGVTRVSRMASYAI
jgi:hypothetical protein